MPRRYANPRDPRLRPWPAVRDEYHRRTGQDLSERWVEALGRRALRVLAARGVTHADLLGAAARTMPPCPTPTPPGSRDD